MKSLCVFCGSAVGKQPLYTEVTRRLGTALVRRGTKLVFGAGHIGLMGVLADAVLSAGGQAIGVIPQALVDKELAHTGLSELRVVKTMHERKAIMAELADGFMALPGGFGTADEFFEILTWAQLGLHTKPVALLNVAGFFDRVLDWLDHATAEGFIKPRHAQLLLHGDDPERLLDKLEEYRPVKLAAKWLEAEER